MLEAPEQMGAVKQETEHGGAQSFPPAQAPSQNPESEGQGEEDGGLRPEAGCSPEARAPSLPLQHRPEQHQPSAEQGKVWGNDKGGETQRGQEYQEGQPEPLL